MRLLWLTDVHFNFLDWPEVQAFLRSVAAGRDAAIRARLGEAQPEAVLVGGDIGEAESVVTYLEEMAAQLPCPIYFVLGNHDYYGGSIVEVRARIRVLCEEIPRMVWLSESDVVDLSPERALVGHDSWCDGRLGDLAGTRVVLNDFVVISELAHTDFEARMHELADQAVRHFQRVLPAALDGHTHVLLLTHCPPWREAAWYAGKPSNDDYLPFFSCKAVGDALVEIMSACPEKRLTVLCGHTHGGGRAQIAPNVVAITGSAVYGRPEFRRVE